MIITILYFVNHFDLWEMHVFTFLSFEVVAFIVIPTAFQKTNNFYVLGSFTYWFSILISFLDTKKKIISVQLQKLASYLDYKMIIELDCAVITVSSVGLIKSMLLKYYSNKIQAFPPDFLVRHFFGWIAQKPAETIHLQKISSQGRKSGRKGSILRGGLRQNTY